MRYYPYGETRSGTIATDRRYTGQRQEIGLGLYDYNARYYDPYLSRFIQADTLVPRPANPQSLNRYAYTLNNPLKYTDPSGHIEQDEADEAEKIRHMLLQYGIDIFMDWYWLGTAHQSEWNKGLWTLDQLDMVLEAVEDFASLAGGIDATRKALDGVFLQRVQKGTGHHPGEKRITLSTPVLSYQSRDGAKTAIVHELAHYWDWKANYEYSQGLSKLNEYGPTQYARTNDVEDWAESVASYTYPGYIERLKRTEPSEITSLAVDVGGYTVFMNYPVLAPQHRAYVHSAFQSLQKE